MTKFYRKPLVYGFVVGVLFFVLAPLGLGIAIIQFLRPILIPGVALFQLFLRDFTGAMGLILGLVLNGVIYSMLLLSFALVRKHIASRNGKFLTTAVVCLVFLAATGMLTNIYLLLTSPDKSWIFQVGA